MAGEVFGIMVFHARDRGELLVKMAASILGSRIWRHINGDAFNFNRVMMHKYGDMRR